MQAVSASREEGGGGGGRGQRRRHGRERVEDAPVCWWSANGGCILPGSPAAVDEAVRAKERLAFGDPPRPSLRRPPFAPVQGCTARAPPPTARHAAPCLSPPPRRELAALSPSLRLAFAPAECDGHTTPPRSSCAAISAGTRAGTSVDDDPGRAQAAGAVAGELAMMMRVGRTWPGSPRWRGIGQRAGAAALHDAQEDGERVPQLLPAAAALAPHHLAPTRGNSTLCDPALTLHPFPRSQEAQHNVGPPFPPPDHAQLDPELTSVRPSPRTPLPPCAPSLTRGSLCSAA